MNAMIAVTHTTHWRIKNTTKGNPSKEIAVPRRSRKNPSKGRKINAIVVVSLSNETLGSFDFF